MMEGGDVGFDGTDLTVSSDVLVLKGIKSGLSFRLIAWLVWLAFV